MYDSDNESRHFIEEINEKLPAGIPKLLVNATSHLRGGQNIIQNMTTGQFANGLNIKEFKDLSQINDAKISELVDTIIMIANEPFRGISDQAIEIIRAQKAVHGISTTGQILGIAVILAGLIAVLKFPQIKNMIAGIGGKK